MARNRATLADLEAVYGTPVEASTVKVTSFLTTHYRELLEASPFAVLATCGPEGLDASPRYERHGLVRIVDERTIQMPDRRGNNRLDSLRNIVRDPRVALLFLIPGLSMTLRVNGRAFVSLDPTLCETFAVDAIAPRSVTEIAIDAVYFQCARATLRSELWNPAHHVDEATLPTAGAILATLGGDRIDGDEYERARHERQRASLW